LGDFNTNTVLGSRVHENGFHPLERNSLGSNSSSVPGSVKLSASVCIVESGVNGSARLSSMLTVLVAVPFCASLLRAFEKREKMKSAAQYVARNSPITIIQRSKWFCASLRPSKLDELDSRRWICIVGINAVTLRSRH
jgi:hypothetical protein